VPLRNVASVTLHHVAKNNSPATEKASGNKNLAAAPAPRRRAPEIGPARTRRNDPKNAKWTATFVSGSRLAFRWSGFRRWNGGLSGRVGRSSLKLNPRYTKHLTFREGSSNIADVFDLNGAIVMTGWRPSNKQFSAKTSFGTIKSRWSTIQSLTNEAPEAAPKAEARYRLTTTQKSIFVLSKLSSRILKGKLSGLSVDLDLSRVTRVVRSKKNAKHLAVYFANGRTFEKFDLGQSKYLRKSISGTHKAGSLSVPWEAIETFEILDSASRKRPVFQATWVVETRQGLSLPVKGLRLLQARASASGISVRSVIWRNVASITPEKSGLSLHFANGDTLPV